ncbi:MAG: flagellar hook assembly protein FlgD [Alphaproteobacteria bacterium]
MVSDVTLSNVARDAQGTNASASALAEDFSQFLTLLTVQLQNQDPLSPMETNEFTNQLVAFTGVEQQINTNQKLDSLVAMNLGNSISSALNYVGKDASYVSSEFYHDGGTSEIKYALDSNAFEAKIRILDESGAVVYEQNAQTGTGSHDFVWDGTNKQGLPAPDGTYEIVVDALDFDGNAVGSSTVVTGYINGIESQDGAIFAIIGDRAVSVGNILNVKMPQAQTNSASAPADDSGDSGYSGDNNNNSQTTG